jgi:hypothetical protein
MERNKGDIMRYVNAERVVAAQLTTPAENPLVTDDTRLMDIWFSGSQIRKQMFRKVKKAEQEALAARLEERGFLRSGNLLFDPREVLFAEMESELVGGLITLGFGEGGKPVELKVDAQAMAELKKRSLKDTPHR